MWKGFLTGLGVTLGIYVATTLIQAWEGTDEKKKKETKKEEEEGAK